MIYVCSTVNAFYHEVSFKDFHHAWSFYIALADQGTKCWVTYQRTPPNHAKDETPAILI